MDLEERRVGGGVGGGVGGRRVRESNPRREQQQAERAPNQPSTHAPAAQQPNRSKKGKLKEQAKKGKLKEQAKKGKLREGPKRAS